MISILNQNQGKKNFILDRIQPLQSGQQLLDDISMTTVSHGEVRYGGWGISSPKQSQSHHPSSHISDPAKH